MKTMHSVLDRFDRFDTAMNSWMVANSVVILRLSMGLVFVGFGLLKFFPGVSPIESLATRTTVILTLGIFSGHNAMDFVATLECVIGICFLTGRFLRVGVWLMLIQMIGAMSPIFLFFSELFPGPSHTPTLAAQYILKDIILVAAGMVIAATWSGARIMIEPKSLRHSLRTRIPVVYGTRRSGGHAIAA